MSLFIRTDGEKKHTKLYNELSHALGRDGKAPVQSAQLKSMCGKHNLLIRAKIHPTHFLYWTMCFAVKPPFQAAQKIACEFVNTDNKH